MVFKISTTCMKCGRTTPEVTTFRIISMDQVVCSICEPPLLEGSCPTCLGHGTVYLFEAWSNLNQVISDDRSRFDVLREKLPYCRTKTEARKLLKQERYDTRYPLLPDWLPDGLPEEAP